VRSIKTWMLAFAVAVFAASCGGGGDSDNSGGVVVPPVVEPSLVAPSVTKQPLSQQVSVGTAVAFVVSASGSDPLQYQWLRNGQDIAGATTFSYAIPDPQLADNNAQFAVRISNGAGSITSDTVTLNVEAALPPATLSFLAGQPAAVFDSTTVHADGVGAVARFAGIASMVADNSGNLFVAGNGTVRKVAPDGRVTTIAGAPGVQDQAVDGEATVARFRDLRGIVADSTGQIFVSDESGIRKVTQDGAVTTVFPAQRNAGSSDVVLRDPGYMAMDATGSIYTIDFDATPAPQGRQIRKITPDGTVTNVAGGYFSSAPGSDLSVVSISRIAVDAAGNLYGTVSRSRASFCTLICYQEYLASYVLKISPDGNRTIVAGNPELTAGANDGPAATAQFHFPVGIASTPTGVLYIADVRNSVVRKVSADGVSTVVGVLPGNTIVQEPPVIQGTLPGSLPWPVSLAVSPDGALFITAGMRPNGTLTSSYAIFKVGRLP
jgi:hypothetical protein